MRPGSVPFTVYNSTKYAYLKVQFSLCLVWKVEQGDSSRVFKLRLSLRICALGLGHCYPAVLGELEHSELFRLGSLCPMLCGDRMFFIRAGKALCMYEALLSSAGNWSKSETPLAGSWLSLFYCRLLFFLSFITTEPTLCNSLWFQPYVTLAEGYGSSGLMGLEASREGWGWYPTDKELVLSLSHMQLLLFLALPKVYRPWEGEGGDARAVGVGSGSIA